MAIKKHFHVILFFLTVFLIIYTFFSTIEGFVNDSDASVCKKIYFNKEYNKNIKVIHNAVSVDKCDEILREGIEYAKKHKWTLKRHDDYPTTDNEITHEWKNYNYLHKFVHSSVFDSISYMFGVNKGYLKIKELFLVKYEHLKNSKIQSKLEKHKDGNEFSFIIALNKDNEYEGGGTKFYASKRTVKLQKGSCVIFSGQQEHEGINITSGKRYIVTGFISYKDYDYCDELLALE